METTFHDLPFNAPEAPAPILYNYPDDDRILVVRDDVLPGGTKSVLLPYLSHKAIQQGADELVYATPVQGGFQIALSAYCKQMGIKCTLFCAKRAKRHRHTEICMELGTKVVEIGPGGYLNVITARAEYYAQNKPGAMRIEFGGRDEKCIDILAERVTRVTDYLRGSITEIWCAIGSGTLCEAILRATEGTNIKVTGVAVGKDFDRPLNNRLRVIKYPRPFDWESKFELPFQSTPHYDRKAFTELIEDLELHPRDNGKIVFWNVY